MIRGADVSGGFSRSRGGRDLHEVEHFWPTADGRQWIELTPQFVLTKQGTMSIHSLLHIQGDDLNTTPAPWPFPARGTEKFRKLMYPG